MFDYLIIGGGISGSSIAYFLQKEGKHVGLVEQHTLCSGASGAAGAFLSPLLGKNNPYKTFVNDALMYSLSLYKEIVPEALLQKGVLRLAKDDDDLEKFRSFEATMDLPYEKKDEEALSFLTAAQVKKGYFFKDGAVVNPKDVVTKLMQDVEVIENTKIKNLSYDGVSWDADGIKASHVIFATGAYPEVKHIPYITIRRVYGCRFDVQTPTHVPMNVHKDLSISASSEGKVAIGATHIRDIAYKDDGSLENHIDANLIARANEIIDLGKYEIKQTYAGIRASSVDYFPIVGEVLDVDKTLEKYPYIKTGSKVPKEMLHRYPNLYIHTGHGARGFVLAPYTAKILSAYLVNKQEIPAKLEPSRLFYKWARRKGKS